MEYDRAILNRLKRVSGQIKGVLHMIDQNKVCADVITQLAASRNAIDRTIGLIVSKNLEQCASENIKAGKDTEKLIKEAADLLVNSK